MSLSSSFKLILISLAFATIVYSQRVQKHYKSCGQNRECLPRHLCKNDTLNTRGGGLIGPRTAAEGVCEPLESCCLVRTESRLQENADDSTDDPTAGTPVTISSLPRARKYQSCGDEMECVPNNLCNNETGILNKNGRGLVSPRAGNQALCQPDFKCCFTGNKEAKFRDCGMRNTLTVGPKIGGAVNTLNEADTAEVGEFPWIIAVLKAEPVFGDIIDGVFIAGGTLIAPNVVITAAHSVRNIPAAELSVRAGEWDRNSAQEVRPHQSRQIQQVIIHERFDNETFFNDIALLITETPFIYEDNIYPLCLPEATTNFDNQECIVAGWGKDKYGADGKYSGILKKLNVPVVPHEKCEDQLRETRLGYYFELDDSFLCAGGIDGESTCTGDGGSPLMCRVPSTTNQYYHAGIVSWGIECNIKDIPDVYASIPKQRDWLQQQLNLLQVDKSHYTRQEGLVERPNVLRFSN